VRASARAHTARAHTVGERGDCDEGTQGQALAWRLRRQSLAPRTAYAVERLVERLAGVQAQVASSAEPAVAIRQRRPRAGAVAKALSARTVVRTWAMRGTLHLLVPEQMAAFQSLLASARTWEKPAWQRNFGVTPHQMEVLGDAVEELLEDGRSLSRQELTDAIIARAGFGELRHQLTSGWGTVLKPLAWTGRLCHGPARAVTSPLPRPARTSPAGRASPTRRRRPGSRFPPICGPTARRRPRRSTPG
jgi:hypothetical protein